MNACYFSYIILNEENAAAFIHQIAYDEIMRIGNEIANCSIGQSIPHEATDPQNNCGTGESFADNGNDIGGGYGCDDDENGHDGPKQRELLSEFGQYDVDEIKVTLNRPETNSEEDPQETYTVDETVKLPTNKGKWWTELTRSLVVRDAIEELGYEFEESQYHFYIAKHLEYDDVAELVFLSEEMKQSGNAKYWFNARGSNWERYYLKV
ncbi:hypothetical protein CGLO_12703 [Colletotrichum gloeosporioides Cg-14]|uniref:DUF8035 domain-containing protein n=1 Tax=Colletotrichum gloeosporioides (strain Cg-14) TaxID=1237896 RepID=T0LIX2_COLGC|nr:hypothetical protein CGLO_12703 [Colletotrichum gloeosporioides Cg-14]